VWTLFLLQLDFVAKIVAFYSFGSKVRLVGLRSGRTLVCKVNMTYQPPHPLTKRKVRLVLLLFTVAILQFHKSNCRRFFLLASPILGYIGVVSTYAAVSRIMHMPQGS
jgi:hypothetical protein